MLLADLYKITTHCFKKTKGDFTNIFPAAPQKRSRTHTVGNVSYIPFLKPRSHIEVILHIDKLKTSCISSRV